MSESTDWINLPERTYRALAETDAMPASLRACVHEYGFPIVSVLRQAGITNPNQIRSVVHTIWCGARSITATQRPGHGGRAQPSAVLAHLDWLLLQNEAHITATTLIRVLASSRMVIVPLEPNHIMVDASIAATGQMGLVSKEEKHRGRLRAALKAGAERLWPGLFDT